MGIRTFKDPLAPRSYKIIACFFAIAFVAVHVSMLMLYNSPDNPIKLGNLELLNRWVASFITQDWSFFAPTPIDEDLWLLARARTTSGLKTPWINVSNSLDRRIQHNRLSNLETIQTLVHNAAVDVLGTKYQGQPVNTNNVIEHAEVDVLLRASAGALIATYPTARFKDVQISIEASQFPRFNERSEPDNKRKNRFKTFPWLQLRNSVLPMPAFSPRTLR